MGAHQFIEQDTDPSLDPVADDADHIQASSRRIVQLPVEQSGPRVDRTLVAAAHRYDHIDVADHLVGPTNRFCVRDVDRNLSHGLHGRRVHRLCRSGAGGIDAHPVAGQMAHPAGPHLGAAGIVDAEKEDAGGSLHGVEVSHQRAAAKRPLDELSSGPGLLEALGGPGPDARVKFDLAEPDSSRRDLDAFVFGDVLKRLLEGEPARRGEPDRVV